MTLSIRDTAFALDGAKRGPWSVRASLAVPMFPPFSSGPISLRQLASRFSASGSALRSLAQSKVSVWAHMDRQVIVGELSDRLRDPMTVDQNPSGLCGPLSIVMELARRAPVRYVLAAKELLETGRLTCPTGRIIEAKEELRQAPVLDGGIGQVDWLLAATLRDDETLWEDVDDQANGLEAMTFWGEQSGWIRDVLALPGGGWETCFSGREVDCMKQAERAVQAGGVAFFLVDANVIKDGGSDADLDMHWQRSTHEAQSAPTALSDKVHSKDDDFPPDHWVAYLGGESLGNDPAANDAVSIRLWAWGREYLVMGTVEAFTRYLYAVVTGS